MKSTKRQISSIALNDTKSVLIDDGNRSRAYSCKRLPAKVDQDLINELKRNFHKIGNRNLRICLHNAPSDPFHDMIILEHRGKYYRPHKHKAKGETFHIIEGKMGVFSFSEDGEVLDSCILDPKGNLIYRVRPGMYHAVMPMTDPVIYHESKLGPFTGDDDSIYPSWAPSGDNSDEIIRYNAFLNERLKVSHGR